nr:MAG TPA: hypothetical protein [Caudoviricetes sp.]
MYYSNTYKLDLRMKRSSFIFLFVIWYFIFFIIYYFFRINFIMKGIIQSWLIIR